MTLIDKYAIKPILVAAVCVALLCLALGRSEGLNAAGTGVEVAGFSFGATIGLIPEFFDNLGEGREAVDSSATPKRS